jgi:hypothetical protein
LGSFEIDVLREEFFLCQADLRVVLGAVPRNDEKIQLLALAAELAQGLEQVIGILDRKHLVDFGKFSNRAEHAILDRVATGHEGHEPDAEKLILGDAETDAK